jgi:hypothetical protein
MPRHRKERAPWHRALRREDRSPRSGSGGASRARRSGRGPAAAWSALRRVSLSPGLNSRFRLARSLLVTPWFAAGAGIVIAAALAVNTPTALTYGPTGPGRLCTTHSCTGARRGAPPQVATATPGVAIKAPDADAKGAGPAPSPHGVTVMSYEVGYRIVGHWRSGFRAVITMRGAGKTGWSLQFAFPAAHVRVVMGAKWHPSRGGSGGTAVRSAPRGGQPATGSDPGQPGTPAQPSTSDPDQMTVVATGQPQMPSSCTLDGISCHFSAPGGGQPAAGADQSPDSGDQSSGG